MHQRMWLPSPPTPSNPHGSRPIRVGVRYRPPRAGTTWQHRHTHAQTPYSPHPFLSRCPLCAVHLRSQYGVSAECPLACPQTRDKSRSRRSLQLVVCQAQRPLDQPVVVRKRAERVRWDHEGTAPASVMYGGRSPLVGRAFVSIGAAESAAGSLTVCLVPRLPVSVCHPPC
jgi:hypothetical protein